MAREGEKIDIGYEDCQVMYDALSAYAKKEPDMSKAEHAVTLADLFYDIIVAERIEMEEESRLE